MNQRATETPGQMLKFAPKEKAAKRVAQLDDAGQAIVAQIRTAADLAKEDCDRAMSLAHKVSMHLKAAEERTHQMAPAGGHHKRYFDCDVPRRHPYNRVDPLGSPAGGVRLRDQRDR